MKRIGLIGGLGPEATIDYYKRIIDGFKSKNNDFNNPDIIVYSVNLSKLMSFMKANKYDEAADYLSEKIDALQKSGADFAAISANTPHLMFDLIKAKTSLPLISIVEATLEECIKRGIKRTGLIGTGFTMEASFYPDAFKKYDIEVVMPDKRDRGLINRKLFTEIELGIFKDETRTMLIEIIEKMVHKQQIDALILGCTEFPLILPENSYAGIPMLNTTQIHVDAIIKQCLSTD
jgi:aspartate racemase